MTVCLSLLESHQAVFCDLPCSDGFRSPGSVGIQNVPSNTYVASLYFVLCVYAVIAAERAVKQKLALQQAGAEDSDAESESEDEDENWGGKKKTYYGDEEVDVDVRSTSLLPVPKLHQRPQLRPPCQTVQYCAVLQL